MSDRYKISQRLLAETLKCIPLGSQTFSKSITHYPAGISPHFITRALGSRVWDADGNEYIDFVSSLGAILVGYADADVNEAVKRQIDDGVLFSLPHPLEGEVARLLVELLPCAEMVRFGKTGSDATSGAVRVARAHTGREHVAFCGYHGWQDWHIGATTRNEGVPQCTTQLSHNFEYNNLQSLEKLFLQLPDQVAAVILEPMFSCFPKKGFLQGVQELARRHGALLIFDEMVTGFRFAPGGAQQYFNVIPDLATIGKGLGNGFAISAVVGKANIMKKFEDVFFSFTHGGELTGLAAALSVLEKIKRQPVCQHLAHIGNMLIQGVQLLIEKHVMNEYLSIGGHPSIATLNFADTGEYQASELKTYFLQEVFARGILTLGTHMLTYSHTEADINRLLEVYDEVFGMIARSCHDRTLTQKLISQPLAPLFRVR